MLGRALLCLDETARALDPELDPTATVRRHSHSIMSRHMFKKLSPGSLFSSTLEMYDLMQQFPERVNTVLETLAGNKLKVKVDAFYEARLMDNLQKIANRIALGLVLAALIVGAALMMQVRTVHPVRLSRHRHGALPDGRGLRLPAGLERAVQRRLADLAAAVRTKLTKQVISVSKAEIDKRERAYREERGDPNRRRPA